MAGDGVLIDLSFYLDLRDEIASHVSTESLTSWFPLGCSSKYFFNHKNRSIASYSEIIHAVCTEGEESSLQFFVETLSKNDSTLAEFWKNLHIPARLGNYKFVEKFIEISKQNDAKLNQSHTVRMIIESKIVCELARYPTGDPLLETINAICGDQYPTLAAISGYIRGDRFNLVKDRIDELRSFSYLEWEHAFGLDRYHHHPEFAEPPLSYSTLNWLADNRSSFKNDIKESLLACAVKLNNLNDFKAFHLKLGKPKLSRDHVFQSVCACDYVDHYLYTRDYSDQILPGTRYHLVNYLEVAVNECAFKIMDHMLKVDDLAMQTYSSLPYTLHLYSHPQKQLYCFKELKRRGYYFKNIRPHSYMIRRAPVEILDYHFETGWKPSVDHVIDLAKTKYGRYQERLKYLLRKGTPSHPEIFTLAFAKNCKVQYLRDLVDLGVKIDRAAYFTGPNSSQREPVDIEKFRLLQFLGAPPIGYSEFVSFMNSSKYSNEDLKEVYLAYASSASGKPSDPSSQFYALLSQDFDLLLQRLHFIVEQTREPLPATFYTYAITMPLKYETSANSADGSFHVDLLEALLALNTPLPPPDEFWRSFISSSERRQAKFYSETGMELILDWCHSKIPLPDPPVDLFKLLLTKNSKSFAFFPNDRALVRFFVKCGLALTDEEKKKCCIY